jgi:hypothetical protein
VEQELITEQLRTRASIFACDETVVVSSESLNLGKNQYGQDVWTWKNPPPSNAVGNLSKQGVTTNSWLNTMTFMLAFDTIMNDKEGRIWKRDFLVKVDPDAVFFPDRLRKHVMAKAGQAVYYLNCAQGGGNKLYGALEVYSKEAMEMYRNGNGLCKTRLQWHGWGEDLFMSQCMKMLGVEGVADLTLVGDERCMRASCYDQWRAAFHPYKDVGSWMWCWRASTHGGGAGG